MAHQVICVYCREKFDRDKEPFVEVTARRYAHKRCAERFQVQLTQEEQDYNTLIEYVKKLLGPSYIEVKVVKQIKDFREEYNYTYSGMLGTLIYWYEVRKATTDLANGGIGIIPYQYNEAREYYQRIAEANRLNADIKNYKAKVRDIEIDPPQPALRRVKLFKLEEDDEE